MAHEAAGLGVMDAAGGQWANTIFSADASTASNAQRYQRTNQTIVAIDSAQNVVKEAAFVSMDSNGFTVNYTTADSNAARVYSLALKGVRAQAGSFLKSTSGAPASQAITGVWIRPRAVLLTSVQDTARTSPCSHSRLGTGASDGSNDGSSALSDTSGSNPTNLDNITKTDKVFMKVNNSGTTIDAEASVTSLDAAGFTLSWTINDAVATEILYLAIQPKRHIVITREPRPARHVAAATTTSERSLASRR